MLTAAGSQDANDCLGRTRGRTRGRTVVPAVVPAALDFCFWKVWSTYIDVYRKICPFSEKNLHSSHLHDSKCLLNRPK